jgi:chemotaxis protein methyltransferase CheR
VIFGITEIKELTKSMAAYPDMDYTNYSLSFLGRRLSYVFDTLNIRQISVFQSKLLIDDFRDRVKTLMSVGITEMFRDPAFWRLFRDKVLTHLPTGTDTIWIPHAPSGEEAFSVSIIINEALLADDYSILCNTPSLAIALEIKSGRFNNDNEDINQTNYKRLEDKDFFQSYLDAKRGRYFFSKDIYDRINCIPSSLTTQLPVNRRVGAILFRNVSLYYNPRMSERVYSILLDVLMPGGFLMVGIKDSLPREIEEELIVLDPADRIYQKPFSKCHHSYGLS